MVLEICLLERGINRAILQNRFHDSIGAQLEALVNFTINVLLREKIIGRARNIFETKVGDYACTAAFKVQSYLNQQQGVVSGA